MKSGSTVANSARRDLPRPRSTFQNELKLIRRRIEVLERRLLLLRIGPQAAGGKDVSKTAHPSAARDRTTPGSGNPQAFFYRT
jgi:hypothetical protein